jgi:hypothetical protein
MIWWTCYILVVALVLGFPIAAALHVRWLLAEREQHAMEFAYLGGEPAAHIDVWADGAIRLREGDRESLVIDADSFGSMAGMAERINQLEVWRAVPKIVMRPNWEEFYP